MLWLKALHIVFVVTWFAGLFYLPRLFVYYALAEAVQVRATLKIMQRRLLVMMHLGGLLASVFGLAVLSSLPGLLALGWMQVKLGLVGTLVFYHLWCMLIVQQMARDEIRHGHRWYRWFNEFPTLILIVVVILVVVKPF
jgi:putative membrane protein